MPALRGSSEIIIRAQEHLFSSLLRFFRLRLFLATLVLGYARTDRGRSLLFSSSLAENPAPVKTVI